MGGTNLGKKLQNSEICSMPDMFPSFSLVMSRSEIYLLLMNSSGFTLSSTGPIIMCLCQIIESVARTSG
jgi:hypothetical protein